MTNAEKIIYYVKKDIKVALPAKIVNFYPETLKADIILLNQIKIGKEYKECPEIKDVPVSIQKAGVFAIIPPYKKDDVVYCLVNDCALDHLLNTKESSQEQFFRSHDIEDLVIIGGLQTKVDFPLPKSDGLVIKNIVTNSGITINTDGSIIIGNDTVPTQTLNEWMQLVSSYTGVTMPACMIKKV